MTNERGNIKTRYAIRNGSVVDIEDLGESERGLKCNCICPVCKAQLQAKLGNGCRVKHFAHNNANCNSKVIKQTLLHYIAKEILAEKKSIALPSYVINDEYDCGNISYEARRNIERPYVALKEMNIKFDSVYLEKRTDDLIPDVILEKEGARLLVEIAVSHFVDKDKEKKIQKLNVSAIEIDLSCFREIEVDRKTIENIITIDIENKRWIYNSKHAKYIEMLRKRNSKIIANDHIIRKNKERKEKYELQLNQRALDSIENALESNNYKKIIEERRNDKKSAEFIATTSFYNSYYIEFPFFLDIPIQGEIAFKCDRRIWQAAVFDKFIYNRQTDEIVLERILTWVFKYNKKFKLDKDLSRKVHLYGKHRKDSLVCEAIVRFIYYLGMLGFVACNDVPAFSKRYKIKPKTLIPENEKFSRKFKEILSDRKELNSNIDTIIMKEICKYNELEYCNRIIRNKQRKEIQKKDLEKRRKEQYRKGYDEIIVNFDRNAELIYTDSFGQRWVCCHVCKEVKSIDEMVEYKYAVGTCSECMKSLD